MLRPRAADDFAVIRARIEELRRESAQVSAEPDARPTGPRPYPPASSEAKHDALCAVSSRNPADPLRKLTRPANHEGTPRRSGTGCSA